MTRTFQQEQRKQDSSKSLRRDLNADVEKLLYVDQRDADAPPVMEFGDFMNAAIRYLELLYSCSTHKNIEELRRRALSWVEPYPEEGPWHSFEDEINSVINVIDFQAHVDHLQPISLSVEFANDYRFKITNIVHRSWKFDWKVGLPTGAVLTVRQRLPPLECEFRVDSLQQLKVAPLVNGKLCVYIRASEESDKLLCCIIISWIPGDLDALSLIDKQDPSTENTTADIDNTLK